MIGPFKVLLMLLLVAAPLGTGPQDTAAEGTGDRSDRYVPRDPQTLAVPYRPVQCDDYVRFVRSDADGFERGPDRGQYGPRHALPALAVFSRSGDPQLANGIKQTLRHYGRWLDQQIAAERSVFSLEGATLLAIHFRELRVKGQVTRQDEQWLRETLLKLRRYQYAWFPGDGRWRGTQHRAITQGTNHLLAAAFYPDEPHAAQWRAYGESVWGDWWSFRDIGINDISYFSSSLGNILRTADLLGRTEVFTDPQVQAILWDRLVYETSPDGALVPYGSHAGWHGLAGVRIWALELAARYSRDGRYRYVASRLMNYGAARGFSPGQSHWEAMSREAIALAALACDDSVAPVTPDPGSRVLLRPEIVRLSASEGSRRFPGAGGVDSAMYMSPRMMPHKLVFRSGWNPGDLYMLVEAYVRHDPLNPTAILGLERWSSSFAEMIAQIKVSRENAVRIEDLSGRARFVSDGRGGAPGRLPLGYDQMETSIGALADDALATHAGLNVANYMGFRADQTREFLFVKNRFVLVRDETRFNDNFRARVGPVWNTQDVGAPRGANWIDTWLNGHWYSGALRLYPNPPWDLLLYYAPRQGTRLTVGNPAAAADTDIAQESASHRFRVTQYAWEGDVRPGMRLQFVSVLLPHAPMRDATLLAESIQVLRDEPDLAAVAIEGRHGWELALLNAAGRSISLAGPNGNVITDAHALYLNFGGDGRIGYSARGATLLQVGDRVLQRGTERGDQVSIGK